jgi:transposase
MDETSAAKGHDYVSVLMAMDSRGVPFATQGKDAATVSAFAGGLAAHGGDPGKIARTSSGISAAFIAGVRGHLPNAQMTSDRFHIIKNAVRSGGRGFPRVAGYLRD